MQQHLLGLWHFDQSHRHVALNAVDGGEPFQIFGAIHEPRRFGSALVLRLPGDRACGPAPGRLISGSVCFWARTQGGQGEVELINVQGELQILIDFNNNRQIVATLDDQVLVGKTSMDDNRWQHLAITFNPDGIWLYLDGNCIASDEQAHHGLPRGLAQQAFISIGPLPAPAPGSALGSPQNASPSMKNVSGETAEGYENTTPGIRTDVSKTSGGGGGIDELAIFNTALVRPQINDLMHGALEPTDPQIQVPPPGVIDATPLINHHDPTCGIQNAINALGPTGGIVQLPPTRLILRQGLVVPSHTTLCGTAHHTILAAPQPAGCPIMLNVRAGSDCIEVEDVSLFDVGDAILIRSIQQQGPAATTAIIERIDGRALWLSQALLQNYDANAPTWVCHTFNMIQSLGQHHVTIRDLDIEGTLKNLGEIPFGTDSGCAAIAMTHCLESSIQNCHITDWLHDGIALFHCQRSNVLNCSARHCQGHGLLLGDGSMYTRWKHNTAMLNGRSGMHVRNHSRLSIISQNILLQNQATNLSGHSMDHRITDNLTQEDSTPPPGSAPGSPPRNAPENSPGSPGSPGSPAPSPTAPDRAAEQTTSVSQRMRGLDAFD